MNSDKQSRRNSKRPSPLQAGAAKADISPAIGIQIAGDIGRKRPCTGVLEPIYARALVLKHREQRYCIVTVDVLAIDTPWADEVRRRAQQMFGLDPKAVLVHATQNHAAPSIGNHMCRDEWPLIPAEHDWLRGGDARYNEPALTGMLAAIGQALANLTPVTVAAGRALDNRVAFNRRYIMRDGSHVCQPALCDPEVVQPEGPADPEVGVVTFTNQTGQVVAALLHHTSHPAHGFWGNEVHPGWPGAWCREMETHFGSACTPLVINGCCGNIMHFNFLNPDQAPLGGTHTEMGRLLAESTHRALRDLRPVPVKAFGWVHRVLPIPRRKISAKLVAQARAKLKKTSGPAWTTIPGSTTSIRKTTGVTQPARPAPPADPHVVRVEWDWVYAVGLLDIVDERRTSPTFPYEMQAVRFGDVAILSLMGEPFVEAQLRIKQKTPFAFLQVAHMSNGYCGYIPTREALAGGGYETRTSRGSRLAPEALEMIEQASVNLLKKLAKQKS